MHAPISTAHSIRFLAVINTNKWYTTDNILGIFTEHTEMIPAARHGLSVWQESFRMLPCRRHAVWSDCKLSNPRNHWRLSTNLAQEILFTYLRLLCAAITGTSRSWVTCLTYMYMNERVDRKLNRHIMLQYQVTVHFGHWQAWMGKMLSMDQLWDWKAGLPGYLTGGIVPLTASSITKFI